MINITSFVLYSAFFLIRLRKIQMGIKFTIANIIFFSIILSLGIINLYFDISIFFHILVAVSYSGFIFFMSSNVCSQFFIKTICKLNNSKGNIFITFDDGINSVTTPQIINILEKYGVKATFFVIGNRVEENLDIAKKLVNSGHLLGNHTLSHSNLFGIYRTKKVVDEIFSTNKIIEEITGQKVTLFRPPFGVTNPNIAKAVRKTEMKCVGWSIRSLDTVKSKKQILERVKEVKSGDIILFHDTKKHTVEILDEFLHYCKGKGLKPELF